MKKSTVFLCGFVAGMCALLCIYWPVYIIRGWWKESSSRNATDTDVIASRTQMNVGHLQAIVCLFDPRLSGDVDAVTVSAVGPQLCIRICMKKDGLKAEHHFVLSDLRFRNREKDGSLRFGRMLPLEGVY